MTTKAKAETKKETETETEFMELTINRELTVNEDNTLYDVTYDGKQKYLVFYNTDTKLDINHDYEVEIEKSDDKRLFSTNPVNYTALNDNMGYNVSDVTDSDNLPTVYPDRDRSHGLGTLPSTEVLREQIARYNFAKNELVDQSDFEEIKGKKYLKKSGWRKFINAFGLTIELIEKRTFEAYNDLHAEVRVRAIAPSGQSVEGIGYKSMSKVFGEKSLHNMIATAWTRAVNRAVSDLVAFGEPSAEEIA